MALVTETPGKVFNLDEIRRGYLLWGRHRTWNEGKAGFVTSATEKQLIVQYHPGIGNVTNHFIVPVSEVIDGQWEIRWSDDMAVIQEYVAIVDRCQEGTEGAEDDDTGGIDI